MTHKIEGGFLMKWEDRLQNKNWDVWFLTLLSALFTYLYYDFKVSEGGDDSAYILRAFDFVTIGKFPSFQGPVYPIFLAILISIFGLKLQILKISSAICMILFFHFGYKKLKQHIPAVVLLPAFLIATMSPMLMYFSSQTYSEAFFLLLVVVFSGHFLSRIGKRDPAEVSWKDYLICAALLWLLGSTRTVGYAALPAAILFLALDKRWVDAAKSFGSFLGVFLLMQGVKVAVWGGELLQFSSQGGTLLLKDPYNKTQGKEDLAGFIDRFTGNADLYLSKHYMHFLGLKEMSDLATSGLTTFIVLLLFAAGSFFAWKNKGLRFMAILTAGFVSLTFIAVQTRWDQARLIIPYLPFITLVISGGIIFGIERFNLRWAQAVYAIVAALLFLGILGNARPLIAESQKELNAALEGNPLAGYTPDWQNYILMSEYAASYAPEDAGIAARKAGISFIYGERKFVGITKIPFVTMDTVAKRGGDFVVMKADDLNKIFRSTPLTRNDIAFLLFGEPKQGSDLSKEQFYLAFNSGNIQKDSLHAVLKSENMKFWESVPALTSQFKETFIIEPDLLVRRLKSDNVQFVILASLRRNPNMRTQYTINTIQRYLYYIQLKYPNGFDQIHILGQASQEPASLYELKYDAMSAAFSEN